MDVSDAEVSKLSGQLADLQKQQTAQEEVAAQKASVALLASEVLDNITNERDSLKVSLDESGKAVAEALVEQARLRGELTSSIEDEEKTEDKEYASQEVFALLEEENSKAASEIAALSKEAKLVAEQLDSTQKELEAVSKQAQAAESSLSALTSGKESIEGELAKRLEEAEKGLSESEKRVELGVSEHLEKEKEFTLKLGEAQSSISAAKDALVDSESETNQLKTELALLVDQVELAANEPSEGEKRLSAELDVAKETKQTVEATLQKVESEKNLLEAELKKLNNKLEEQAEVSKEKGEEATNWQEEQLAFEEKEAALQDQLEEMAVEKAEHKVVMSSKQVELNELVDVKESLNDQLMTLNKDKVDGEAKQHEMQQLIEALEQSSSYSDEQKEKAEKAIIASEEELAESYKANEALKKEIGGLEKVAADGREEIDSDALSALQSELNLVREQTEKDVKFMQEKVEKSEKMNGALKAKIKSMQTLANEDIVPKESDSEEGKKKGWW